ncbi:MAG: DNA primase [Ktedonobacteraceae bacterium]|nr:DNA primase [Ktedonobacteraceae bacterium]
MASIIETIKAKVDVAEEIGLVVALQKSGKALKGLCPFHNERTASFYVFPESQTWRCFGCNEGGDVFSFVQKQQGFEFREALHYLAEKAGVQVEEQSDRDPEAEREANATRERLRKLNEDALLWFHQMLLRSKEAAEVRAYVQRRGISSDTVLSFALGYAPDQWEGLSHYLLKQGYTERELVVGGLAREREEKSGGGTLGGNSVGVYDYFRNRLIFPIRDTRGRVIGFGGRALGEGKPKYLNSPQTLLFEKNSVLYAIDMARDAIKQVHQVVIVEGYVDAIIAHQYGTKQTVACIGSAITEKHIQQLKKLTRQVTLALDPDAAGSAATEHGIQEALSSYDRVMVPIALPGGRAEGKRQNGQLKTRGQARQQLQGIVRLEEQVDAEINVMMLPDGKDPDEMIQQDLPGWIYAVSHPVPLIDYYFKTKLVDLDLHEPAGQTEAAKRLLPVIGMINDRIRRDAYVRKLARMISTEERSLHDELQHVLRGHGGTMLPPAKISVIREQQESEKDEPEWISDKREEGTQAGSAIKRSKSLQTLDRQRDNKLQWEDYLIGLLVQNPALISHVCVIINDGDFAGTDTRELYHILNSVYHRASSPSNQPFEQFVPSELLATVARVQKCVESGAARDGAGLVKEAVQCATRLKRTRLLQLNMELKYLLDEAYRAGNTDNMRQLMKQKSEVDHQLRTIDTASR